MSERFAIRHEMHFGRVLRCDGNRPTNLDAMLRASAAAAPERVALQLDQRRVRYGELMAIADRVAGNLATRGVRPADRVAIALGNRLEFAFAVLGCLRL